MKVVLERFGSPYNTRKVVKVVYEYCIGRDEYAYTMDELLRVGSAIESLKDTTSYMVVKEVEEGVVVETRRYRVNFPAFSKLMSLEEELPFTFKLLSRKIGYRATLGLLALHFDKVKVEKIAENNEVSSEESEVA